MKLEKEFFIKSVEGDFYYSTIQLQGEVDLTDEEKREYFKAGGRKNIKAKLIIELPSPILDEKERKYLSDVIRPFRNKIERIIKKKSIDYENKEYIIIHYEQLKTMPFPYFEKSTMYKGMELNKEYTLEELGL